MTSTHSTEPQAFIPKTRCYVKRYFKGTEVIVVADIFVAMSVLNSHLASVDGSQVPGESSLETRLFGGVSGA